MSVNGNGLTVGIDPGMTGAIAKLNRYGELIGVYDMPVVDGRVNAPLLADMLPSSGLAVIELVHAMPKNGSVAGFKLGRSLGVVEGVLGAFGVPVELVTPTTWKKAMKVTADKETSRRRAIELWPDKSEWFKRKLDHGRAEACLIARWRWEQEGRHQ